MAIQFVNLINYPIAIWKNSNKAKETVFPPSGTVAKVKIKTALVLGVDNVEMRAVEPMSIEGLPDKIDPELRYIVADNCFKQIYDRKDLCTPFGAVRQGGALVAYRFLACHPKAEIDLFYARAGCFSAGLPLKAPKKCQKYGCKKYCEEDEMAVVSIAGKPWLFCPDCALKRAGIKPQETPSV